MNVFLDLAERQVSAPVKARRRGVEKRAARKAADTLSRAWSRWRVERREALLAGLYGDEARKLIAFLDGMSLHDGVALVALAEHWRHADADTRFEILSLVDTTIIARRERAGLTPFDDALPDEPPNVFLLVREVLA